MNKKRGMYVIGAIALTTLSAFAFFDWRQVTIESNDGKRVYKRVDHDGSVRLLRRLSDKPCVQGRSWGYDRNGIWVDDGCRAVFEYERRDSNDRPSTGYNTQRFTLSSNDGKRVSRRVDTSGGVRLIRRLSDASCVQGRSWGYDRNSVWVDDGCRAEFEVRSLGGGRDPWLPGNGVPNWAVGDWQGHRRPAQGMKMVIRRDGSIRIDRPNASDLRGEIRGNRVEIGDAIYRLEKDGKDGIVFMPVRAATGAMYFSRD
jgi:hypothetical protein